MVARLLYIVSQCLVAGTLLYLLNQSLLTTGVMHYFWTLLPALILQTVMQPITTYEHALFSIYALHKDPASDPKLKRPFADPNAGGPFKALAEQALAAGRALEEPVENKKDDGEEEERPEGAQEGQPQSREPLRKRATKSTVSGSRPSEISASAS
eukprot:jgi/Mesen1/3411/ME000192S02580